MELVVEKIGHRYGELVALEGIDLAVREDEILALIGPSGCGKSTLLGIMGGILRPSAGRILVKGAPPADSLNPFTYIFQDFALLPWRSVEGNVALPLEHHGLGAAELRRRVADVLARTGLAEFRTAYPKQLSGGMRQRVGIARALAVNPAILLMDEPLSALDAQTRELLMEDFLALWLRARTTAVYVTHNLAEALRLADRVAVLSRRPGRLRDIVAIDIPQADRATPAAQAQLAGLHDRLWGLIKAEAQIAEREVIAAGASYG
ncbi:MAG: ABC transporter ATP-binding protein [Rhodospirillales bacterium]|nr:ABC transporter ATP-binding protein [Rhodospirillales bacterium]